MDHIIQHQDPKHSNIPECESEIAQPVWQFVLEWKHSQAQKNPQDPFLLKHLFSSSMKKEKYYFISLGLILHALVPSEDIVTARVFGTHPSWSVPWIHNFCWSIFSVAAVQDLSYDWEMSATVWVGRIEQLSHMLIRAEAVNWVNFFPRVKAHRWNELWMKTLEKYSFKLFSKCKSYIS